jgi:hypothetical protein
MPNVGAGAPVSAAPKPTLLSFRAAKPTSPDPSPFSDDAAGETPRVSPASRYSERRKSRISCCWVLLRLSKFSSTVVASLPLLW